MIYYGRFKNYINQLVERSTKTLQDYIKATEKVNQLEIQLQFCDKKEKAKKQQEKEIAIAIQVGYIEKYTTTNDIIKTYKIVFTQ